MPDGFDIQQSTFDEKEREHKLAMARLRDAFLRDLLQNNHFYVFLIAAGITLSGVVVLFWSNNFDFVKEFWKIIVPVITLYMGYAIGGKARK